MIFSKELVVFYFVEATIAFLFLSSLYFAYKILKDWDFDSTSPYQFKLEKRDYFVSLTLFFALIFKILLLPYYINLLDKLSYKLPGAMCAAGVVNANEYGLPLLVIKIFIIFIAGIWIYINASDKKEENLPFIKPRYYIFLILFVLIVVELALEYLYFSNINTDKIVMCCSTIYGVNASSVALPFGLGITEILYLFYLIIAIIILSYFTKNMLLHSLFNLFYLFISFYALTYLFSTYVYELPTHKCPYCLFQSDYYYVGYLLWGSLIAGVFYSLSGVVIRYIVKKDYLHLYKISTFLDTIFALICSAYVVIYYLRNGVFL
jgi:hypothetical protein